MKKILLILAVLSIAGTAYAYTPFYGGQVGNNAVPGYVLQSTGSNTPAMFVATSSLGITGGGGSGTVTSVSGSGGTTGLTLTGGPITTSGTLTLGGVLNFANGGTGTTTNIFTLFPSYSYASTTFPSYAYGSSTYYLATNPAGYITSAGAPVQSVSNVDGTLTISPTTGAVVASRAAITGDVAIPGGSNTATLATVNGNVGTFQGITVNGKGLVTGAVNQNYITAASLSPSVGALGTIQWASSTAGQFMGSSTQLFFDSVNNRIGIGTTTPTALFTGLGTTGVTALLYNLGAQTTTSGGNFVGNEDSGAAIVSNTKLGGVIFGGARDATHSITNAAAIEGFSSGNWSSTSAPADLVFKTTAVGTTTRVEVARLTSAGFFGIGTTSPISVLAVVGTTTLNGELALSGGLWDSTMNNGAAGMVLQSTGTSTIWVATSSLGISGGGSSFTDNWPYSSTFGGFLKTGTSTDRVVIGTSTPFAKLSIQNSFGSTTPLFDIATTTSAAFATSSIFRILANGNVGIGTSTPTTTLAVVGTILSSAVSPTSNTFLTGYNSVGTEVIRLTEGSNVGSGGGAFQGYRSGGGGGSGFQFIGIMNSDNSAQIANFFNGYKASSMTGAASSLVNSAIASFNNNGTELMRIAANGNVGIGTTTPVSLLSVVGKSGSLIPLLTVSSSTGATTFSVDSKGHQISGGTAPTITACGTTPNGSVIGGNDNNTRIQVGGGVVTSCTETFAQTWTNPPVCTGNIEGGLNLLVAASSTASGVVLTTGTSFGGDVLTVECRGY